jgi:A1 cistron-splicing factor AAR2
MVFLDAPKKLHFGVDYKSWQIGPKFKGVKFIPPGLHFIYYGSVNSFGDYGARSGFFKYFDEKEIIVKEWDTEVEDLKEDSEMDKDQIERIKYNIREFDQYLGPYPLIPQDKESVNVYQRWLSLTSKINKKVIQLILPKGGKLSAINSISHFSEIQEEENIDGNNKMKNKYFFNQEVKTNNDRDILNDKKEEEEEKEKDMDTTMTNADNIDTDNTNQDTHTQKDSTIDQEKYRLNFTLIDLKKSYPEHATSEEITKYSIDKSYLLKKILKKNYKGDLNLFLGEFQLSYIIFLIGQVYDGFEQWKTIIVLMLQCEEALETYGETLFKEFFVILNDQLRDFPHDFFYDVLSGSNFLRSSLKIFYRIMQETNGRYPGLEKQFHLLLDHLSRIFQWDLEEEFHETDRLHAQKMKEKLEDYIKASSGAGGAGDATHGTAAAVNEDNTSVPLSSMTSDTTTTTATAATTTNPTTTATITTTMETETETESPITMEDLQKNPEQLLKLMEELGIEDEEDLPMIVNLN